MEMLTMFLVFMKIGIISFGGGYAMIPFLQYEGISRGWLTESEIIDMIAMSQITPGPIATNMATFVGYNQFGVVGAVVATIGVTLPAFILAIVVTKYIIKILPEHIREGIFFGLKPVFIGLLSCTVISLARSIFWGETYVDFQVVPILITVACIVASLKYNVSTIKLIIASAIVGVIVF